MKKYYFVRHGLSKGNIGNTYQEPTSGLSELGIKQAEMIAERCCKLPVEIMVSSTLTRAEETAKILSNKIHKPFELSGLFVEYKRPSEQYGLVRDSEEAQQIDKIVSENYTNSKYHYSDEENFSDLCHRAEKALEYLSELDQKEVLIVTHGLFLRTLIGKAIFGQNFTAAISQNLFNNMVTTNTGISIMEFDQDHNQWLLRTFNDYAHLG